nr:daptide biosynthesis intramembrane metalloprotease [Paenarthrobacter nitroguajacolicus]
MAAVLMALDGHKDARRVAEQLGAPWTVAEVTGVVDQLASTGIFDAGTRRTEAGWIQFRAPLTVQLTLFDPARLLASLRALVGFLLRRESLAVAAAVLLWGIISLLLSGQDVVRVFSTPLPLGAYLGVAAALFASTLLHEIGHGAALAYCGGKPRRIGIMLFYLSPAFFCDVTDGWRLASRKQRVMVALAGPLVHLALGSIALCGQGFLGPSALKDGTLLYGVLCFAVAVLNLFPFIKLDGYVALMAALDTPHLRRKSLDAAAELLRHHLLGTRPAPRQHGLLPWFGAASFAAGVAFMVIGFQRLLPVFLQLGFTGYLVVALVLGLLTVLAIRSVVRFFRKAGRNGSTPGRRALAGILGVAAVIGALWLVPVTPTQVMGYVVIDGRVHLVAVEGSTDFAPNEGDRVSLQTQGMVIHRQLGLATLGSLPPSEVKAPLEALVPVTLAGVNLTVIAYDADLQTGGPLPAAGRAEVTSSKAMRLVEWLWTSVTTSPLLPDRNATPTTPSEGHTP